MNVFLRDAREVDLDFILAAEQTEENSAYIGQWSRAEHLAVMRDETKRQMIVEAADKQAVGYLILEDLDDKHGSLQLRRLVITRKRRGYGLAALEETWRLISEKFAARRLWLDVFENNFRAISLYRKAGFREEKRVTKAVGGNSQDVMLIMSLTRDSG